MNNTLRHLRRLAPIAAGVILGMLVVSAFTLTDEENYFYRVNRGLETFGQVYREISTGYVEQADPDQLISAGIDGMLAQLDPYTVYLQKREAADINMLTSGSYGGIGIRVGVRDSMLTILDVIDGHSAQRQGLRIGDVIYEIDGQRVSHRPLDTLREFTRGEANTTLEIAVLRDGVDRPIHMTLTREQIPVTSVTHSQLLDGGIGYIRLERFSATAGEEVREAIEKFRRQGELNGIVLDLRDNPGGLLESAVDVCAKFLPAGSTVVTTRGRLANDERVYRSKEAPIAGDVPLAVIVNGSSASASEIVAGAVQDLDRGIILGTRSFGKGLVQSVRRLSLDASLKLTTARYYTPSGRCIQRIDYSTGKPVADDTTIYLTHNGRAVHGGGGILPDTIVASESIDTLVAQLRDSEPFFHYVTRVSAAMDSLPRDFHVDDAMLADLERTLGRSDSALAPIGSALSAATELEHRARSESLPGSTVQRIDALHDELAAYRRAVIHGHREQLRQALQQAIEARFLSQQDRMRRSIAHDAQVHIAAHILRTSPLAYDRLVGLR